MEGSKHTSNTLDGKKNFNVTLNLNPLDGLKRLYRSLPQEYHKPCAKKYGAILDLLFVPVEASALGALARYWNSSLRCFELPNLDITPTIEEYACILNLPMKRNSVVYFYQKYPPSEVRTAKQFGELLGLPANLVELKGQAGSRGVTRMFLESYLEKLKERNEWGTFVKVLALAVYGLVLFPSALNMVDQIAMDVFYSVDIKGRNPVPAVLAETFLSLSFCCQKRKGKLRCCAQLLYMWIITHMYSSDYNNSSNPFKSFNRIQVKQCNSHEWMMEFHNMERKSFKWLCPWYRSRIGDVIYSCGDFPNVPLMGPRGCIAYTPALVLKQLGWTQKMPREEQLGGCHFWYRDDEETKEIIIQIKAAWRNIRMVGKTELGKQLLINTSEYLAWREARVVHGNVPEVFPKKNDHSKSVIEMVELLEVMKAQMQTLEQQKQDAELEAVNTQSRYEKMAKEIEHLKDECADITDTLRKRTSKQKVAEIYFEEIQDLERRIQSLSQENYELKDEINQHDENENILRAAVDRYKKEKEVAKIEMHMQNEQWEQRAKELTNLIIQIKVDCDQGWASASQYRDQLEEALGIEKFWRTEALNRGKELKRWAEKYEKIFIEMDHHVPKFVQGYEKAKDEILENPMLDLPQEVNNFMGICKDLARGFKRKRMNLLM